MVRRLLLVTSLFISLVIAGAPVQAPLPAVSTAKTVPLNYDCPPSEDEFDKMVEDDKIDWDEEIQRVQKYPDFPKYLDSLKGDVENDFEFGGPEGDPGEDLRDFVRWLHDKHQGSEFANVYL